MNKKYSDEENKYIKDNAANYNDEDLARSMSIVFNKNFSKGATRKQRQRLGIKKSGHRGHFKVLDETNTNEAKNV